MANTKSLPAPNLLARITLSYPDKVQRKTPFLSHEIKPRPFRFFRLCVAPEVHLKTTLSQGYDDAPDKVAQ